VICKTNFGLLSSADAGGINPYAKKQMININNKPFNFISFLLNNWL